MKYKVILIIAILAGITAILIISMSQAGIKATSTERITIGSTSLKIIYAKSEQEKTLGLGQRDTLDPDTGMLFVYSYPQVWTFWMHGMRFPLDFVWIEKNQVRDITENVPPPAQTNNQPRVVQPKVPVSLILEVNAGWVKEHTIKIGDTVQFQ
jgi:uncharacterized membrane protein (UPF0127 family)